MLLQVPQKFCMTEILAMFVGLEPAEGSFDKMSTKPGDDKISHYTRTPSSIWGELSRYTKKSKYIASAGCHITRTVM